jgi:two-component system CheB/CheR fusion protein
MRQLAAGEIPSYTVEKRFVRKDGEVIWALVTATLIRSEEGEPIRTIAVVQDMTERKNAHLELQRATQEAEAANAAKDQFLAVLSHELRTPLTPVLATVEVLREEPLPEEIRPFIDVIHRNIELEARLIDDLLDLTRIIKGKLRLNVESVDAHALIQNVLDICRADISGKRLLLVVDLHAVAHHVRGDSARLQQVFWNLVKNAVKFTPEGGIVTIRSWNDDGRLMVEVADTGIGIEEDILPIIFNAFEQGEQNITRRFGGLGLGLAISKSIVDMHNGIIEARSPGRGAGAIFTVTLPVTHRDGEEEGTTGGEAADPPTAEGVRILVVDDHKDTASVLRLLLERRNYHVYTAYSVEAALDAAERQAFDLVISDIGLPAGSGLDLLKRLRERGPIAGIAVSGFGTQEDIARSIDAGFAVHLVKPFSARRLHEVIDEVLRGDGGRS